eukprot:ctg_1349.g252
MITADVYESCPSVESSCISLVPSARAFADSYWLKLVATPPRPVARGNGPTELVRLHGTLRGAAQCAYRHQSAAGAQRAERRRLHRAVGGAGGGRARRALVVCHPGGRTRIALFLCRPRCERGALCASVPAGQVATATGGAVYARGHRLSQTAACGSARAGGGHRLHHAAALRRSVCASAGALSPAVFGYGRRAGVLLQHLFGGGARRSPHAGHGDVADATTSDRRATSSCRPPVPPRYSVRHARRSVERGGGGRRPNGVGAVCRARPAHVQGPDERCGGRAPSQA